MVVEGYLLSSQLGATQGVYMSTESHLALANSIDVINFPRSLLRPKLLLIIAETERIHVSPVLTSPFVEFLSSKWFLIRWEPIGGICPS